MRIVVRWCMSTSASRIGILFGLTAVLAGVSAHADRVAIAQTRVKPDGTRVTYTRDYRVVPGGTLRPTGDRVAIQGKAGRVDAEQDAQGNFSKQYTFVRGNEVHILTRALPKGGEVRRFREVYVDSPTVKFPAASLRLRKAGAPGSGKLPSRLEVELKPAARQRANVPGPTTTIVRE